MTSAIFAAMELPAPAPLSNSQANRKRQCWECHRRRLVCDFSQPSCNKCLAAGVDCPGYGDQKPLKWLTPGTVNSRPRKQMQRVPCGSSASSVSSDAKGDILKITTEMFAKLAYAVETGMLQFSIQNASLGSESCAVFEAVSYYNECICPDYVMHELVRNPAITAMPLVIMHYLRPSMCHSLTILALGHRLHRLLPVADPSTLVEMRSSLYYHRGEAIRCLAEDIANEQTRNEDITICSILEFMMTESAYTSLDWRQHFAGGMELIALRGGMKQLFDARPSLQVLLFMFMMVGIIGSTTTPPSDITPAISQLYPVENIAAMYSDSLFPSHPCPLTLFLEIANINQLRLSPVNKSSRSAADAVLKRISDFLPEHWSSSKEYNQEAWLVIGRIYKSAVAIYCISSLQHLSILPKTSKNRHMRTAHGNRLFQLLPKALASPLMKRCVMWPMAVAGMEAVNSSQATRDFIETELCKVSGDMGTFSPLAARAVLKRFWESGKTGWDECFDAPCVFG